MDKNTKKIQPHEAEAILQKFKDNKWLVEKDGIILLSTRFIYEMEPFLKDVYTVKSLTLEATPPATQFFKRSYKNSHIPGL